MIAIYVRNKTLIHYSEGAINEMKTRDTMAMRYMR